MVFKQNDGTGDYFVLALEDQVVKSASTDVYSYWHQVQHSSFVEIIGVQWAMETDYNTAYYTDERLLVYAYFKTNDGGFALLSIEYDLSAANGNCMCIS